MQEAQSIRGSLSAEERNTFSLGYWSDRHIDQERKINPTAERTTFGMRDRNSESAAAKVPSNSRPVTIAGNHPTAPLKTGRHN